MEHAASGRLNQRGSADLGDQGRLSSAATGKCRPVVVVAWANPGPVPGAGLNTSPPLAATPDSAQRGTMSDVENEMPEPTDEASDAEDDARTGEQQAATNRENDPPA